MQEVWKDVAGYEGRYQVSNFGRVRSFFAAQAKKSKKTEKIKYLRLAEHSAGYLVVNLRKAGKSTVKYVHRLVAQAFLGTSDLHVNHKDLNKKNNNIGNLEYVTSYENLLHAAKNGVKVGKTILNTAQRREIRVLRKQGLLLSTIAKQYGISESAVSEVARGTTWRWENE